MPKPPGSGNTSTIEIGRKSDSCAILIPIQRRGFYGPKAARTQMRRPGYKRIGATYGDTEPEKAIGRSVGIAPADML